MDIGLGKINQKRVEESIRDLEFKGKTKLEKRSYLDYTTGEYKESETPLTEVFGETDPKVKEFLSSLSIKYEVITENNFKAFLIELNTFSDSYQYVINDIRQTKEELITQQKQRIEETRKAEEENTKRDNEIKASGNLTQSEKITLGTTEISKQIRNKLKDKFPSCVFSVVKHSYSGGSSITVSLMSSNFKVIQDFKDLSEEAINKYCDGRSKEQLKEMQEGTHHQLNASYWEDYDPDIWNNGVFLTRQGHDLFKEVMEIVNYYNWDNSDGMTDYYDVNFYTHLNIGKGDNKYILTDKPTPIKENSPKNIKEEIEFIKNEDKNGLEIYFKSKPDESTRDILKQNGFRWGRFNKCWYKRDSDGLQDQIKKALGVV